jgi:hypothetical protein
MRDPLPGTDQRKEPSLDGIGAMGPEGRGRHYLGRRKRS